jgi:hypothetical protein
MYETQWMSAVGLFSLLAISPLVVLEVSSRDVVLGERKKEKKELTGSGVEPRILPAKRLRFVCFEPFFFLYRTRLLVGQLRERDQTNCAIIPA